MLHRLLIALVLTAGVSFTGTARAELFGWISAPPELNVCDMPKGTLVFPMRAATFMANAQTAWAGDEIQITTLEKTAYRRGVPAGAMITLGTPNGCTYDIEKIHPKIPNLKEIKFAGGSRYIRDAHGEFIVKIWAPIAVDSDRDFIDDSEDRCIADPGGRGVHLYGPRIGCADGQAINH